MVMNDPLIGRQLANFKIERLIGRGGMALVYYGEDQVLHRSVAIKIIDARLRDTPSYARRFVQEARTVAQWRHEHIVQVYYADQEEGLFYFVMEYIDGIDLELMFEQHEREGRLIPVEECLRIGRAVASALDYAHERGVIHRDIKPSNIMIARDGRVALTDFGLALDIEQGSVGETFGSALYMAPEQAQTSSKAVPQSDLYSLAVIMYQMLTGDVPFFDPSPTSVALQHLTQPPPSPRLLNPELNEQTERVLLKGLSKEPEERYQRGAALIEALANSFEPPEPDEAGVAVAAAPVPPVAAAERPSPPPAPPRWLPWLLTGGGLLLFLSLVFLAGLWLANNDDEPGPITQLTATLAATATTPATQVSPAPTDTLSQPIIMTSSATPVPAATTSPTPDLAITASPRPTEPEPQNEPTATVLYPDGRPLRLIYDDNSFYLLNPTQAEIPVRAISFEALEAATDQPTDYRFNGRRWSVFHPVVEGGHCDRLEITESPPYLLPVDCQGYNATVTPGRETTLVFWTARAGIDQFRVLWEAQEIGRCPTGGGHCLIYIPG